MGLLDGKVAVITGSSRGLGLAIARAYAQEGARVVLSARTQSAVDKAAADLRGSGAQAAGITCDVSVLAQVQALGEQAAATFGQIDIWINNAGSAGVFGPTADVPVERYVGVVDTNILGTYYGSMVALRHFLPRRRGKLVNLLGAGSDSKPIRFQNAYAPSKAWIRSFTLALAKEYQDSGVGIFAFNPGLVDTELLRQVTVVQGYEQRVKPLEMVMRLWANQPDVPAQKALWLASSATDGKTGLEVKMLRLPRIVRGILGEAVRRVTGKPAPDTSLTITSVPSAIKNDPR